MSNNLSTIGSIAYHLNQVFQDLPTGISGVLIDIVDMARQHVQNYTNLSIGSNSIPDNVQSAILDFCKADVIDLVNAQPGGAEIHLGELSLNATGELLSAQQYRQLGEMKLQALGKGYVYSQALS